MNGKAKKIALSAIASVVSAGMLSVSQNALAASTPMEKCYGIVKKGMNDCGNAQHACQSLAPVDGAKDEWIYLPKGTCEKIVGGETSN